ncbi:PAS domain S-box protein, partial [candidate division GN15 bacterium]|nr:PAS domain S-box protein [candidate division GN15 bacterium]
MKRSLRRLGVNILGWDYLLPVAAVVLLVILSLALYTVYVDTQAMRDQLNRDFNRLQSVLARQIADQLESELEDIAGELRGTGRLIGGARDVRDLELFLRVSHERLQLKGITMLGLRDDSGQEIASATAATTPVQTVELQRELERLCENTAGRDVMFSDGRVHHSNDATAISALICTRVSDADSRDLTLYARLDITDLLRAVAGNVRSGVSGYAWVLDQHGRFLYHPDNDFIGHDAFAAREERRPYLSFEAIDEIMRNRMLTGEEGTGEYSSGWHLGDSGEIAKLMAFCPVRTSAFRGDQFWSVAVSAPSHEVAEPVASMRVRHIAIEVAMLACILGFALLVLLYQRQVSRVLKERVSRQEEYLSSIVQNSVDGIVFIDNDNHVQMWNRGAELIFGYTASEMVGQSFRCLVPPELEADRELGCIMEKVYRFGHVANHQTQRLTKSGRRITVNISRTLIRTKGGEPIGSTAIIKDVSDHVELEERIYNTEKLASIGILAAGVAHEINNPLAIILGFTDLLKERYKPGQPELDDLKMIEENANHAKQIVQDLLGFARVSEGQGNVIDLNNALKTVLQIVRNTLTTKKIDLHVEVADDLPDVLGDTREFQQVVFNLINNAVAAMPDGG